jgi:hypothetical protein
MAPMSTPEQRSDQPGRVSRSWSIIRKAAQRVRGDRPEDFIPPWRASPLDDIVLNRPLNLLFRVLRFRVLLLDRIDLPLLRLKPGVTIAIVNWNSMDLLKDVLRAIDRFGPPARGKVEVLIVDNGSTDGSRAFLRQERARHRLRCVLLPRNVFHGPAMDLAFLLATTEFVVALDVDAFPIADDWLDRLITPLQTGRFVSGAEALRGYIHPCCLAMRTAYFARRRHTFTPKVGTWNPDRLGRDEWDTGESITRREGLDRAAPIARTSVRGPRQLGSVFGEFVYHNGASTRMRSDVTVDGLTSQDVEGAWSEAVALYLGPAESSADDATRAG